MVEADLFDKLARIGSIIRKKPEPFGGIQVRQLVAQKVFDRDESRLL